MFHDFHRFSMIFNNFERRQYPGSTPAIPRSFGKLRGRVWGPRGEKFAYSKPSIWAPFARTGGHQHSIAEYFFNYFLIFNNFLSPFFQISRVSLGIFLGSRKRKRALSVGQILAPKRGPVAKNSETKRWIWEGIRFGPVWSGFGDDANFRPDPTFTRASPGSRE